MSEECRSLLSHYSVHIVYMYSTCQSADVQLIALQISHALKIAVCEILHSRSVTEEDPNILGFDAMSYFY